MNTIEEYAALFRAGTVPEHFNRLWWSMNAEERREAFIRAQGA